MRVYIESRDFKKTVETKAKTVKELLKEMNLLVENFVVSKDGEIVPESEKIKHNSRLKLYPVISGG
jgi:sulfur carrier protein ThiS